LAFPCTSCVKELRRLTGVERFGVTPIRDSMSIQ